MQSTLAFSSEHHIRTFPRIETQPLVPARELTLQEVLYYSTPHLHLAKDMNRWKVRNFPNIWRGLKKTMAARLLGISHLSGQWCFALMDCKTGERIDYGLCSLRVITNSGANYVVDAFQGSGALSNFRYHGIGGGSTPESVSDQQLEDEHAAEYESANTRPTGTLQEGTAENIFRSIAFINVTDSVTITEAGIFSQASTISGTPAGGYLLDRGLISTITAFAAFTIQSDYRLTVATGT